MLSRIKSVLSGALFVATAISVVVAGAPSNAIAASDFADSPLIQSKVSELIIQYGATTPLLQRDGLPWGIQCLKKKHRDRITLSRGLGASMWTLKVKPPAGPKVASLIVNRLENCPGVMWAEPSISGLEPVVS